MDIELVSASMPWVEKYRPHCLDDLISHESILLTRTLLLS